MGAVDLDDLVAGGQRALGGGRELAGDLPDLLGRQLVRYRVVRGERQGLGASGCQPCASGPTGSPPFQVRSVEALRPAWAIWMPGTAPWALRKEVIRRSASTWVSFQMPRS